MTSKLTLRGSGGPRRPGNRPERAPRREDSGAGDRSGRPPRRDDAGPGDRRVRRGRPQDGTDRTGPGSGPRRGERPQPSHSGGGRGDQRPPRRRGPAVTPFTINGDLLFGRNAVLESLRAGRRKPTRLWIAEGLRQDERVDAIVEEARLQDVLVESVIRTMQDDQLPDVNHQGVLLETSDYPYVDLADVIEAEGTVLILDHLQDPQNFGTLLRSAAAAGVAGVIIPDDRSASVSAAVVNASAGAVERLSISTVPNLGNAIEKLESSGRWIIGLDGGPGSVDLFETDIPMPAVIVVGSEGSGLTANIRKRCQVIVSIPMSELVESLNAATAGSIVLFDIVRRTRSEAQADA